jgi:hypothetical protein
MSMSETDLASLLFNLDGKSDEEAFQEGEKLFHEIFISRNGRSGALMSHDGEEVKFFADRYHHAFRTSSDRARRAYSKGVVARERLERLRWIRPIIEGKVAGVECWEVPKKVPEEAHRPFPGKRLYVSWSLDYLIWLEPLSNGGFKFSTAYLAPHAEIARYTTRGRKLWAS